ncbi:hypothetical protein Tco_0525654 [Tanacetum coccineum]
MPGARKELKLCEAKSSVDEPPEVELKEIATILTLGKLNEATQSKITSHCPSWDQNARKLAAWKSILLFPRWLLGVFFQIPIDKRSRKDNLYLPIRNFCLIGRMPLGYAKDPGSVPKKVSMAIFHGI